MPVNIDGKQIVMSVIVSYILVNGWVY